MRFTLAVLLFLLAACVPAQVPPQLSFTPGPPITITENTVETAQFTVRYPRGWRVVKLSIAGAPPWLAFISDDDTLRIEVRAQPFDDDVAPLLEDIVQMDSTHIYLRGMSESNDTDTLQPYFDLVRESLDIHEATNQ